MASRRIYTTAPRDYDYLCTDELLPEIRDSHGSSYRLVEIHDDRDLGGTFHEGQMRRYESGMHTAVVAGSAEARARGLVIERVPLGQIATLVAARLTGRPLPEGWEFLSQKHTGDSDAFDVYFRDPEGKVCRFAIAALEDLSVGVS